MYSCFVNPQWFPDAPPGEQWEDKSIDVGEIEVSSGSVDVKFQPINYGSRIPGLGPNGTDMEELQTIVDELSIPDIKRTLRSILQ